MTQDTPQSVKNSFSFMIFSLFIFLIICIMSNIHSFKINDCLIYLLLFGFLCFISYYIKQRMNWARILYLISFILISLTITIYSSVEFAEFGFSTFFSAADYSSIPYLYVLYCILILFMMIAVDYLFKPESNQWFSNK